MSHGVCLSRVLHFSAVFLSASSLVFPVSPAQTEGTIKRQADTSQVVRLPFSFLATISPNGICFPSQCILTGFFWPYLGCPHVGQRLRRPTLIVSKRMESASTNKSCPQSVDLIPAAIFTASHACIVPMIPVTGEKTPTLAAFTSLLASSSSKIHSKHGDDGFVGSKTVNCPVNRTADPKTNGLPASRAARETAIRVARLSVQSSTTSAYLTRLFKRIASA